MTPSPARHTPLLESILQTGIVSDGTATYPLHSHMSAREGEFLQRLITDVRPTMSLEVGMAYGISTLFICEALSRFDGSPRHVVMDPMQHTDWRGIGLRNVREAGFASIVEFHADGSEAVLPRLLAARTPIQFALIDGWHTLDQVLLEFYYVNRMLDVGGVVAFDDVQMPAVNRALRYVLSYPTYRLYPNAARSSYRPSLMGRGRRALRRIGPVARLLRPEVLTPDWELGLGTCVAVKKLAIDDRPWNWYQDF